MEILADVLLTFKDKDYSLYEIAKQVESRFRSRYAECPSIRRDLIDLITTANIDKAEVYCS